MPPSGNARTTYMVGVLTLAFLVSAAAILTVAMVFTTPASRGFLFWFFIGLLCFLDFLGYFAAVGAVAGRVRRVRVSTVSRIAIAWVLVAYGVCALLAVGIYALARDAERPWDVKFSILFGVLTALFFLAAFLIRAYDIWIQGQGQADGAAVVRQAHAAKARTIGPVIAEFRAIGGLEGPVLVRVDRLCKKLDGVEAALAHSHGGGIGSREGGPAHRLDPAAEGRIDELVGELEAVAFSLHGPDNRDAELSKAERIAGQLERCISAMDLA